MARKIGRDALRKVTELVVVRVSACAGAGSMDKYELWHGRAFRHSVSRFIWALTLRSRRRGDSIFSVHCANAGVGPRQRSSSTLLKSDASVRNVASFLKS